MFGIVISKELIFICNIEMSGDRKPPIMITVLLVWCCVSFLLHILHHERTVCTVAPARAAKGERNQGCHATR